MTPIEDIYSLATRKDFDGNDVNRAQAGMMILMTATPVKAEVKEGIIIAEHGVGS
ncbi:hypothetical protein [Flavobacterium aestivum]|uniref:hypothetical protein n=1 Tax=Flavobacterium aestivum TaxID=3003257 RepID=UPI0022866851|nr:hypothetical protein [Flavobacterium aestivum]